ncbi:hypothetical protein [Streptacidiphilus sp. MAP5-3]|uniref:LppU/SCO3897 family protein n=1 Tax=unclassified Streptacidiphilus TaxID=2643834 RepID=UPI003517184A
MATERDLTPPQQPPHGAAPGPRRHTRSTRAALGALGAAALVLALATGCQSSSETDPYAGPTDTYAPPTDPYASPTDPNVDPTDTYADPTDTYAPPTDPYSPPADTTPPSPSPFDSGTCLNGTLPDSTTAQTVNDVNQVDCSASDAHYKVIQVFYETTDLSQCDNVSDTQYSFSSQETWNGATINSYVYCLVGLGSYAR